MKSSGISVVVLASCCAVSAIGVCWIRPVTAGAAEATSAAAAETASSAADQLVAQAIEAEAQGNAARRGDLLEQAISLSPEYAAARWQAGQVRYGSDWATPEDVAARAAADELLVQYREMRKQFGDSKDADIVLARWCQKHQMSDELRAHVSRLLAISPADPEAIKLMGLTWHEGLLLTPAEVAERKVAAERAKEALKIWQPRMSALRQRLESSGGPEREAAFRELGEIRDPAAIEAIEIAFKNRPNLETDVVRTIGQMPGSKSTQFLLREAMLTKRDDVRRAACDQLRLRPRHAYVPQLMSALSLPAEARLETTRDADGVHFRQTVRREGATSIVENSLQTNVTTLVPNANLGAIIGAAYNETLLGAQDNARAVAKINRRLSALNDTIYSVLASTTDQNLPSDPRAWWTWWHDYNEMANNPKETIASTENQNVDVSYMPYAPLITSWTMSSPPLGGHMACFAPGTPVWTITGPMPIEQVRVGDRVLAQDPATGELAFKPVLQTTRGEQELMSIRTAGDQIKATLGHVFWVSGAGWRMAKDLEVGDRLHTDSGWTEVQALKDGDDGETHNLVVADFGTFFVGKSRVLVHDFNVRQPTMARVPGQAETVSP